MTIEHLLQEAKLLSASDRALLARSLISSLEEKQDQQVDSAWLSLVEKRIDELDSNAVRAVTWKEIKDRLQAST